MGVLNVTPDSFSDGGRFLDPDQAFRHAARMLEDGADIIDIGGESSRPAGSTYGMGAEVIDPEDEIRRVLPVIELILKEFPKAIISIDTYKAEVARAALEAGACMVNDITAFRADPDLPPMVAQYAAPVVLMHSVGEPGHMPHSAEYSDVVDEVKSDLRRALEVGQNHGIQDMIIDPGFGFGKSVVDNLTLVARLSELEEFGRPILVGISRKSSIGVVLGSRKAPRPVEERLYGSLAAATLAVMNGASIIRTHDVGPTLDVISVTHAMMQAGERDVLEVTR
jgi:dihydropteroate synthase